MTLVNRVKEWTDRETWTDEDINAEIDNILDNLIPASIEDYSTNAAQQLLQSNPGTVETPVLAESLAEELEQLRFVIARITGESQWITSPQTNLAQLSQALGGGLPSHRIVSGRTRSTSSMPDFLRADGGAADFTILATATPLNYYIDSVLYTAVEDIAIESIGLAPSTNNTCLVNAPELDGTPETLVAGEFGSIIPIDNVGSEISARNGQYAAFSVTNGGAQTEYFIAKVNNAHLSEVRRGYFFDSAGAPVERITIANNDTITLLRLTFVFIKADGTVALTYNNPTVSLGEPSAPSTGDYWRDLATGKWMVFGSTTWEDAEAVLIGVTCQTSAACVGTRSYYPHGNYQDDIRVVPRRDSTSLVVAKRAGRINVFGNTLDFQGDDITWNMAADFEAGYNEAASTVEFLYMTEDGDIRISPVYPYDLREELQGFYHPYNSWRCIGVLWNDEDSDITHEVLAITDPNTATIVAAEVDSNALTVHLITHPAATYPLKMSDPSYTYKRQIQLRPHLQATVPNTAVMGHRSSTFDPLYVYLVGGSTLSYGYLGIATAYFNADKPTGQILMSASSDIEALYTKGGNGNNTFTRCMALIESFQTTAGVWADDVEVHCTYPVTPRKRIKTFGTITQTSTSTVTPTNGAGSFYSSGHWPAKMGLQNASNANAYVQTQASGTDINGTVTMDYGPAQVLDADIRMLASTAILQLRVPPSCFHVTVPAVDADISGDPTVELQMVPGSGDTMTINAAELYVCEEYS